MSGKGSKQRPMKVDRETFEQNWDLIFGDKEKESKSKESEIITKNKAPQATDNEVYLDSST